MSTAYRNSFVVSTDNPPQRPRWRQDYTDIILSVHRLRYVTIDELARLHCRERFSRGYLNDTLNYLFHQGYVRRTRQSDPENRWRKMPYVYTDSNKGRQLLEKEYGIPYLRLSHDPASDQSYINHNLDTARLVIGFMKTAEARGISMHHLFDLTGESREFAFPVEVALDDRNNKKFDMRPDYFMALGDTKRHFYFPEIDCGNESIESDDLHKRTVLRAFLSYAAFYQFARQQSVYGMDGFRVLFLFDSRARTEEGKRIGSRKRVDKAIDVLQAYLPGHQCPLNTFLFCDRYTFMDAGDDISLVEWISGNGKTTTLF